MQVFTLLTLITALLLPASVASSGTSWKDFQKANIIDEGSFLELESAPPAWAPKETATPVLVQSDNVSRDKESLDQIKEDQIFSEIRKLSDRLESLELKLLETTILISNGIYHFATQDMTPFETISEI